MMTEHGAIGLAERVLAVLDQGGRSATYKFALFIAILDLVIKKTTHEGPPTVLTTREVAEQVVELYWPHASPYETGRLLRQAGTNDAQQAEVISAIESFRRSVADPRAGQFHRARLTHPDAFEKVVRAAEWKLIEMPIPRLQKLGRRELRFLYEYNWTEGIKQKVVSTYQDGRDSDFDNRLLLLPGCAESLVRLNGLLRPLIKREWALKVAELNRLPESQLEAFLFGADRTSLRPVGLGLRDLQENRCFYCDERLPAQFEVDHFIPWSLYQDNGLDNLVVAHRQCNNHKRDHLAAATHLTCWRRRSRVLDGPLSDLSRTLSWDRCPSRAHGIAAALYVRLPRGTPLWLSVDAFEDSDPEKLAHALFA